MNCSEEQQTRTDETKPQIDGWAVTRHLGRGSSSNVWLAESSADPSDRVVVKVPIGDRDTTEWLREAEHACRLRHPHIVGCRGTAVSSHGPVTVWDHCPAGDLLALIHAVGPLSVPQSVTILVPLAQALEYAHRSGIVHGDVSPGNVLFDLNGKPLLSDIGEARALGADLRFTGTEGFAAPELDREHVRPGLNPEADVYSLAAVAWFSLTGRLPSRAIHRPPLNLLVPDVEPAAVDLLEAALDEDPTHRPTPAQFAVACYEWADPEPVQLHSLVDEPTALYLPTRTESTSDPVRRQAPKKSIKLPAKARSLRREKTSGKLAGARKRMRIGIGAGLLGTSLILSTSWATQPSEDRTQGSLPAEQPALPAKTDPGADNQAISKDRHIDWQQQLDQWSNQRSAALNDQEADSTSSYAVADGPVAGADRELIDRLTSTDTQYQGLSMTAELQSDPPQQSGNEVQLRVLWQMSKFTIVDETGEPLESHAASSELVTIKAVENGGAWLIDAVIPDDHQEVTG